MSNNTNQTIRITWKDDLTPNMAVFGPALLKAINTVMFANAPRVQSYARHNAPWTDRTGNARNGLFAKSRKSGSTYAIDLYHTVPYGIWLEVRWSGRYQIIRPTIDIEGTRIMSQIKGIIATLGAVA